MNTCSHKRAICTVVEPNYKDNFDETDDILHYFALPNSLDNDTIVQVLQNDTTASQLTQYDDKMDKYWKEVKKSNIRRRQWRRIRKRAELLVQLKRELRQAYKLSKTEDGGNGIHWWPETEMWKHLEVKEEEQSIPDLNIKVDELPTPNWLYPSDPSCYTSLDLNNFMDWGDLATT